MKSLFTSLRIYIFLTLILGLAYPLVMTGFAQLIFPYQANGSLLRQDGKILGSELIGQKFTKAEYFSSRPSATDYSSLPSAGSNLAPTSESLKTAVSERTQNLKKENSQSLEAPPSLLLFSSASGLDPHISPEAAYYQVPRIAEARSLSHAEVKGLIAALTQPRQLGILGEETVNVLKLNLALDRMGGLAQSLDSESTPAKN